jgi:hypothetical protein
MADFYRVNGSAGSLGSFVSFIGKTPKCYGVKLAGADGARDLTAEMGVNGALGGVFRQISANATILAYQVENNTSANVSIMLEAPSELTATNIRDIIRNGGNGAGWYGNTTAFDCSTTLVTDTGFKLAYS